MYKGPSPPSEYAVSDGYAALRGAAYGSPRAALPAPLIRRSSERPAEKDVILNSIQDPSRHAELVSASQQIAGRARNDEGGKIAGRARNDEGSGPQ